MIPNANNFPKKECIDTFDVKRVKTEPNSYNISSVPVPSRNFFKTKKKKSKNRNPNNSPREKCTPVRALNWKLKPNSNNASSVPNGNPLKKGKKSRKRRRNDSPKEKCSDTPELQSLETEPGSNDTFTEQNSANVNDEIHTCNAISFFQVDRPIELVKLLMEMRAFDEQHENSQFEESNMSPYELWMNDVYHDKIIESIKRNLTLKSALSSDPLRSDPATVEGSCSLKSYPWENNVNNPSTWEVDFKIRRIVNSILYHPDHLKNLLNQVIGDLNEAVEFEGFTNRWNWYGSYLHGLVCVDSRIDLHYECVPKDENNVSKVPRDLFQRLCTCLQGHEKFVDLKFSGFVPFPWIRLRNKATNSEIEITISNELNSGELRVRNSLLTKLYLDMSPDLKHLTIFLKLILQRYMLHGIEGSGKLKSYTLFWLIVFFMQQKKLLPAVIDIRKAAEIIHYVSGWDCSLPDKYSYPTEPVTLYSLVVGFFDFYRNFDFLKYLICPYLGRVLLLSDFERLQIPIHEFSIYRRQLQDSRRLTFCRSVLNLQDPSDLRCNVAERIHPENLNKFKILCHRLHELLSRFTDKIEKIDCFCKLLPFKMDYGGCFPYNLTQCCTVMLRTTSDLDFDEGREKKLNQIYILEAVRKIMELVFKFKKESIVIAQNVGQVIFDEKDESVVKRTFPVIYFEYRTCQSTWECDYMKEIIPRNEGENEPIRINITCEIGIEDHLIKIFIQSNIDLIKFLNKYFCSLLKFSLSEIIPV